MPMSNHHQSNSSRDLSEQQLKTREDVLNRYFLSRTDAFAQWNSDLNQWQCIRQEIPPKLLWGHTRGRITVATYPVNDLGNSPFICFDIDSKRSEAYNLLAWLHGWFTNQGVLFLLEETGGRGLHGWALFLGYVPAIKAIALANLALDNYKHEVGSPPCPVEIFPKQAKPADVGNPTRLPWGKHGSGNFSHFLNLNFEPDDEGAIEVIQNGKRTTEFDLDKILPETVIPHRAAQREGRTQNEVLEMLRRPLLVGERRPTLVKLAGYLRYRGIPEEVAVGLLLPWGESVFKEPLPAEEIERHIRGIYGRYGVTEGKIAKVVKGQALATILPKPKRKGRRN